MPLYHYRHILVLLQCSLPGFLVIPALGENHPLPVKFSDLTAQETLSLAAIATHKAIIKGKTVVERLPASLAEDQSPRIVFLSAGNRAQSARVVMGTGIGLPDALHQALSLLKNLKNRPSNMELWLKIDLVLQVSPLQETGFGQPFLFDPSLEGISLESPRQLALLPEEIVAARLVDDDHGLSCDRMNKYTRVRFKTKSNVEVYSPGSILQLRRFSTASVFCDGKRTWPLYRGHRQVRNLTPELLMESARLAGEYLTRSIRPDGSFHYIYYPRRDTTSSSYNLVRHAGTVFALLDLYQLTRDKSLLESAEEAIRFLVKHVRPFPRMGNHANVVVYSRNKIKLGAVALAIVALAKHVQVTSKRQFLPLVEKLGQYIVLSQEESGRFMHQRDYKNSIEIKFVSDYYPGEAILALLRLYSVLPEPQWLDCAERNAQYLVKVRDKGLKIEDITHDHWLLYALNELYRHRPKEIYLNHASRIAKAIYTSQNRQGENWDQAGSYYDPPRSTPTATRTEGLIAAYQILSDFGDKEEARRALDAARWGIHFQLGTQFFQEKALYMAKPGQCLGGFSNSLTDMKIRIDYVQHNISALIGLYRIITAATD